MIAGSLVFLLVSSFIKQRHPEREVTVAIPVAGANETDKAVVSSETEVELEEAEVELKETEVELEEAEETEDIGGAAEEDSESDLTAVTAVADTAEGDQTAEDDKADENDQTDDDKPLD